MYRLKTFRNLRTLRSLPWVGMGHSRVLECSGLAGNGHCPIRFEALQPKIDSKLTRSNPLIQIRAQHCQDQTYPIPTPRFVNFWVLSQIFCLIESYDIRIFTKDLIGELKFGFEDYCYDQVEWTSHQYFYLLLFLIFMAYYFDVYETCMISTCTKIFFINMWTQSLCIWNTWKNGIRLTFV